MIGHRLGVLDSPSYRPFINAFKQAWPWQADSGGAQWGSLVAGGHMRAGGQLLRIAPGSNGYRTRLFHNMPAQAGGTGRWRLRWNGQCTWDIYGASNVTRTANEIQFDFTANGSSWVDMVVRTIGSDVSGISLAHESDWADQDAGRIFRRQFLQELAGSQALRFDEWIGILRSENEGGLRITSWESRGLPSDEIFYRFVPYEWMCALANEVGAEPWICLPTAATDDHMRKAAELVRGLVPAPRRVHVEYSTKTWDFSGTPQAHYCSDRGRAAFNTTDGAAFRNWYGMRATQMALIWKDVWQNDPRLRTVVQHQADWVGGEVDILEAPLWRSRSGQNGLPAYVAPHSVLDVLTVHAQIDGGMAYGGGAGQIDTWRTTLSQTEAFNRMRDRLLTGSADRTVRVMTPKWRHYRNVASGYGMGLSSYEVGNHLNGVGGSQGTRDFVHAFSVSAQMGEVYAATFNALEAEGFDGPLCMSVDCRLPDANISHGLQRWLGDHNPAWAAVDALIEDAPVVVPPVEPEPEPPVVVNPEPEQPPMEPEPEEPNMADRDKLRELLSILKTTTADLESYLTDAPVVVDPPVVTPPPVADRPIWETAKVPVISAPASVEAPSGQNVVWVPVTLDHTDMQTVLLRVSSVKNASPATINVGNASSQARYIPADVYRWSPGDDLTHYVRLQLPGSAYSDGQQIIYQMSVVGANTGSITVRVIFRDGAQHPDMPAQRHRAAYKLDLSTAQRANVFNPSTLKHSDSGFDAQGNPCWRSRLSHGYSQPGNGETGLYMNEQRFPGVADRPVTYDAAENAIRLHTNAAPDAQPYIFDGRVYTHQAAMIQGQTIDEVCGNAGVWRMVAKSATRQYSWPAFWLVGRGSQGADGGFTQWPPEIDIMEQFNGSWGAAYTEFTTSCGQHYGNAGSNERRGSKGYVIETDKYLGETEPNTAMHSYACAVQWNGNDAWVTFFFDDKEIATQVLLARHQDMQTRLTLYPMANVAVRALGGNADSYNNNARTGDMLVRDIGYYPSGYKLA